MKPEIIAFVGVLASTTVGGLIAFLVATLKTSADQKSFEQQIKVQIDQQSRNVMKVRSDRKLDIAYKFAELHQKDATTAALFMNEVAKETAIGFLFFDDDSTKAKIWIRNDANILIGRSEACDIMLSDPRVSRQHCVIHSEDDIPYLVPLNPTNPIAIDGEIITTRTRLTNGSVLTITLHEFVYFEL